MFASIMRGPNILLRETAEMWSFCYGDEMLKLDEKKIRKGKPIGLPYQGSKKKISKKIIEIIKQNFGTDKPIYVVALGKELKNYLWQYSNAVERTPYGNRKAG